MIDDNDTNLSMAKNVLKDKYRVMTMQSAAKMFSLMEKVFPDLILLDIEMPEMDGFEALVRLKKNSSYLDIPVIFLTSVSDSWVEARGFELGAVDFITKPFSAPVLFNRVKLHLNLDEMIKDKTAQLLEKIEQMHKMHDSFVHVVANMIEHRDRESTGHLERILEYVRILIDAMTSRGVYADELTQINVGELISSSLLHDIGNISVPEAFLNKPGKLTEEEYKVIKRHPMEGENIIERIITRIGSDEEFLHSAKLFAGHHHEHWDGSGYPGGLGKTEISIQGRIMAIVDVYDALVSTRPYKKAYTHNEAVSMIMENAGKQFDPLIAEVFFEVNRKFEFVALCWEPGRQT